MVLQNPPIIYTHPVQLRNVKHITKIVINKVQIYQLISGFHRALLHSVTFIIRLMHSII